MANAAKRRADSRTDRYRGQLYVEEGNAVRKLQVFSLEEENQQKKRQVSHVARKNRAKALRMSRGYVLFLALVSTAALGMCVNFASAKGSSYHTERDSGFFGKSS